MKKTLRLSANPHNTSQLRLDEAVLSYAVAIEQVEREFNSSQQGLGKRIKFYSNQLN
jgi:hypothetical protein